MIDQRKAKSAGLKLGSVRVRISHYDVVLSPATAGLNCTPLRSYKAAGDFFQTKFCAPSKFEVTDWATQKVLSRKLSSSTEADFWFEDLNEAIAKYGQSNVFNTDQGSQFTWPTLVDVLLDAHSQV